MAALIDCKCLNCDKPFKEYRSRIALGRGKHCSRKCSNETDRKRPLGERFWEKVDKSAGPDGCWLFCGASLEKGYGAFNMRINGKDRAIGAHRIAWELANGPQPDGMCVLHSCDNPPCCNPSHLFLGTVLDNNADMKAKGRHAFGERNGRAKLTIWQVKEIRASTLRPSETMKLFSEKFGITQGGIKSVIYGENWKGV